MFFVLLQSLLDIYSACFSTGARCLGSTSQLHAVNFKCNLKEEEQAVAKNNLFVTQRNNRMFFNERKVFAYIFPSLVYILHFHLKFFFYVSPLFFIIQDISKIFPLIFFCVHPALTAIRLPSPWDIGKGGGGGVF